LGFFVDNLILTKHMKFVMEGAVTRSNAGRGLAALAALIALAGGVYCKAVTRGEANFDVAGTHDTKTIGVTQPGLDYQENGCREADIFDEVFGRNSGCGNGTVALRATGYVARAASRRVVLFQMVENNWGKETYSGKHTYRSRGTRRSALRAHCCGFGALPGTFLEPFSRSARCAYCFTQ
jgi:hypothetical protein